MRTKLSDSDITIIKYQMRGPKVIALLILTFGAFYSFFYFSIPDFQIPIYFFLLIDLAVALFAGLVFYLGTRKFKLDIQEDHKLVKRDRVQRKEAFISHETGSGTLYIPVLGNLFPKLFSIKMKSNNRYYLIISNTRYRVEEELYHAVNEGDFVDFHFTAVSNLRLSINIPSKA